jgi:hypothetical protein
MNKKYIVFISIIIVLIILLPVYFLNKSSPVSPSEELTVSNEQVPTVEFPFKNLFDDKGKKLNIILISAPFREKEHEDLYEKYKSMGLSFCGISSYLEFPGKIDNPYEDKYHEEKNHDYTKMVSSWLHCFREPPQILENSGLPMMQLAEADLKDFNSYKPDHSIRKEYDFIYVCLNDNEKCEPGWNWYIRNWDLAKECLEVMCRKHKLTGIIVGRENCEFTDYCTGIVKVLPFLPFNEFQKEMQKCKFLFVPNVSDASPRVITEAICYNMPVLVNEKIVGGWNNVVPGVTGEFFKDEYDVSSNIEKIMNRYSNYTPREWFERNRGKEKCGRELADFLVKNYPNINNKNMSYATITI